jgi:hypothetical protein
MFASILIIAFSLALFIYWFRYSCILVLRNYSTDARPVADSRFSFASVQEQLQSGQELDPLHKALNRDYQVITFLIQHAAGLEMRSFEERLLVLDYRVMHLWYRMTRVAAPEQARNALVEMASVVGVLVGKISERAGIQNEA